MVTCEPCQGYGTVKQRDKPPQNESFIQRPGPSLRAFRASTTVTVQVLCMSAQASLFVLSPSPSIYLSRFSLSLSYINIYIYECMYVCKHTYISIYLYLYIYTYIYTCILVLTYADTHYLVNYTMEQSGFDERGSLKTVHTPQVK